MERDFGLKRTCNMGASNHLNHPVLVCKLECYLLWRNANARHPSDMFAAQRRERDRGLSDQQRQWGRPAQPAA